MTAITALARTISMSISAGSKKAVLLALSLILETGVAPAQAAESSAVQSAPTVTTVPAAPAEIQKTSTLPARSGTPTAPHSARKPTIYLKYAFDKASHIAMPGWDRLPRKVNPADTGSLSGICDLLPQLMDYRCSKLKGTNESDTISNKPWLLPHPTDSLLDTLRQDLKKDPTSLDKRRLLYRTLASSGYWLGYRTIPPPDYHLAARLLLESAWLQELTQVYDHRQFQSAEGIVVWAAENQIASDGQYLIGQAVANESKGQGKKDISSLGMDEFFKLSKEIKAEWNDVQTKAKPKSLESALDFLPNRQALISAARLRAKTTLNPTGDRSIGPGKTPGLVEMEKIALAENFFDQAKREDYEAATKDFDTTMKGAMPVAAVESLWQSWQNEYGKFEQTTDAKVSTPTASLTIVSLHCKFEKASRTMQFILDKNLKICGLRDRTIAEGFTVAPYVNPSSFWDEDVIIGEGQWLLPGSLSVPIRNDKMPAVVLVHGSGPNDRDETVGKLKPFRDIAWGLASRGIVVLRYEKRTREHSAKISNLLDKTTVKEETIDDALDAVQLLKNNRHVDSRRIFVLGHSLGGMLIPRLAQDDPTSAGYIIMAGAARPLEDIILEQEKYLLSLQPEPQSDSDKKAMAAIEGYVAKVKDPNLSPDVATSGLPPNWPPIYWLDLRGYKPAEKAKEISRPLLIMQGGKDYQVTSADYKLWQEALKAKSDVTFKFYPDLAHPFTKSMGVPSPADYNKAQNVSQAVVEDLAEWIKSRTPRQIESIKPAKSGQSTNRANSTRCQPGCRGQ